MLGNFIRNRWSFERQSDDSFLCLIYMNRSYFGLVTSTWFCPESRLILNTLVVEEELRFIGSIFVSFPNLSFSFILPEVDFSWSRPPVINECIETWRWYWYIGKMITSSSKITKIQALRVKESELFSRKESWLSCGVCFVFFEAPIVSRTGIMNRKAF